MLLLAGVIGITDVTVVAVGGAKVVDMGEQTMAGFIATVESDIARAAA